VELAIVIIFIIGYTAISIEHTLRIDKLIPALLMMTITWALISFWSPDQHLLTEQLLHHFGKTTEILIFLMGAMAIVEMIDYFDGFKVVQALIRVKTAYQLLIGYLCSCVCIVGNYRQPNGYYCIDFYPAQNGRRQRTTHVDGRICGHCSQCRRCLVTNR